MGCIALVRRVLVLRCGLAGMVWYPYAGWSLHTDTTPSQPHHEITQHISLKLLSMDVLTSETCWALNNSRKTCENQENPVICYLHLIWLIWGQSEALASANKTTRPHIAQYWPYWPPWVHLLNNAILMALWCMRISNAMPVNTSLSLSLSLSLGLSTVIYPPSSLILTFMVMKTTQVSRFGSHYYLVCYQLW